MLLDLLTAGIKELAELPESKVCWDSLAPLQRFVMPNETDFNPGQVLSLSIPLSLFCLFCVL